jgi:acyl-CoA reductase-like NAD-dependent aldehyde dehydrogenase
VYLLHRADRAAFDQTFERDWNAMSGEQREACDSESAAELARLRTRLGELEAKLEGSSDTLEADAEELRQLVAEEGR